MRDIDLGKIVDHAHDKPILQQEARKELYARHQEDLKRQEELRREMETDIQEFDSPPTKEPPAPVTSTDEVSNEKESDDFNDRVFAEELAEEFGEDDSLESVTNSYSTEDCPECNSSNTEVIVGEKNKNGNWLASVFSHLGYFGPDHLVPGKVIAVCPDCDEIYISTNMNNEYFAEPEKFK